MKHTKIQVISWYLTAMTSLFAASCVNTIPSEEKEKTPSTASDIPIRVSSQILCTQTRVSNNEFENDDAIGLYVLAEGEKLNQTRYIDNMRLTCTSSSLVPDKDIYYPAGDGKCTFISYYPYQEAGIHPNESSMDVSIKSNQSSSSAYSISDFMTASVSGITPSKKQVTMNHYHKLCQLNIILKLADENSLEDFQKNASIMISNVYTQATYDFVDDDFTALNTPQDIVPNGTWVLDKENSKLTGKKILLFPQAITNSKITLRINNREFTAPLPKELILASNTSSEITLHCDLKIGIDNIVPSIGDWQEGSKGDANLEEEEKSSSIRISSLDFEQTHVHHIYNSANTFLAEICKEYLLNEDIDAQAIVLYPADNPTLGTVLQILNSNGDVHGGSVLWSIENHSFAYTVGSQPPITSLYVDAEGNLSLEQQSENSHSISSTGYVLTDSRGSETITYPIVKIGTQYWMRENLSTTKYNSGGAIPQITKQPHTSAGYYSNSSNRFYNKAAVIKGIMAPDGWKIPSDKEWEVLKEYTNNTAAVLKAGSRWETSQDIGAANNLTGFNAQPIGFYTKVGDKESSKYSYANQRIAFWNMGNSPTTLAGNGIMLLYDDATIRGALYSDFCGYSIRCIRK